MGLFDEQLDRWREHVATPWARIRYAVVAETLRRTCAELGDGLRVLDVGGGDGRDALPLAAAGHDVTVMDPASGWLAEARRRAAEAGVSLRTIEGGLDDLDRVADRYDLVLCHYVLRYRPAEAGDIAALARRVRPGGRLSLIDLNPAGRVLGALVRSGPEAALTELDADTVHTVTFDHETRRFGAAEAEAELTDAGLQVVGRYGARIANDLLTDDAAKHDPGFLADLLALELALCDQEPYCRVGALWQLVAEAPGT